MTRETQTAHHDHAFRQARAIWGRRKWLIVLAFIAPFSAAVSLVAAMPNLYRASATVLVEQEPDASGPSASGRLESRLEVIGQEVLSRARLEDLIARFNLYPELRRRASPQAVIDRMRKDIRFKRKDIELPWGRGATVAFTLGYLGREPQTVAQVTNTLASLYVEENEKLRRRQGSEAPVSRGADGRAEDKLAELKRQLAEARARFNDRYPDVIRIKAEIAALEQERRGGTRTPAAGARPGAPDPASALDGGRFRIIDSALPPAEPIAPNRLRLIFMALILSLGAAGAAAILVEQMDTSFHRLDQLWFHMKMPILAGIPRIVTRADTWRRRLRLGLAGVLAVSGLALLIQVSYFLGRSSEQLVWMLAQHVA